MRAQESCKCKLDVDQDEGGPVWLKSQDITFLPSSFLPDVAKSEGTRGARAHRVVVVAVELHASCDTPLPKS